MIYLVAGSLLAKASLALREGSPINGDELTLVQQRRISALLRRLGRIWSGMFAALNAENVILEGAVSRTRELIRAHGIPERSDASAWTAVQATITASSDPVRVHALLLEQAEHLMRTLHEQSEASWAQRARRQLRRDLAAAAAIESALLDSGQLA